MKHAQPGRSGRHPLIIETRNLTKRYKDFVAVNDVSMHVRKGSIYGFLGPNGAGKSTTMKMLLGLTAPTSGTFEIDGMRFPDSRVAILKEVGSFIESPSYYANLTGRENLDIIRRILGLPARPPILILDEPTNGLDPAGIHEIRNLVKSLPKAFDCTVLVSSHMLSEIELVADDIGILNHGTMLYEGSLDNLRAQALASGYAAENLEELFLAMIEQDNLLRKQRAVL